MAPSAVAARKRDVHRSPGHAGDRRCHGRYRPMRSPVIVDDFRIAARRRSQRAPTGSRSTPRMVSAPTVPLQQREPAHRRLRRLHRQSDSASRRGRRSRGRRDRRRTDRHADLARQPARRHHRVRRAELYRALSSALAPLSLAYLHVASSDTPLLRELRGLWPTALMLNRSGTDLATRAPISRTASPMSRPSAASCWPTRIWSRGCAPTRRSTPPDRSTFYGGASAATWIIRPSSLSALSNWR